MGVAMTDAEVVRDALRELLRLDEWLAPVRPGKSKAHEAMNALDRMEGADRRGGVEEQQITYILRQKKRRLDEWAARTIADPRATPSDPELR